MVKLKETSIIIISTHIVSDIDTITDDLIILNKGSVIANDSPEALFEHIRGMVGYSQRGYWFAAYREHLL